MVNELNKPPSQENIALGERLVASQRQLQEMQEEHHQLLQEMEVLRQRAAALSRLNEQQFVDVGDPFSAASIASVPNDNAANNQTDATEHVPLNDVLVEQEPTTNATTAGAVEETTNLYKSTDDTSIQAPNPATPPNAAANDEDAEDPETAAYLQEKLAEIAKLKARFQHVKNIMSNTEMIEEHISSKGVNNCFEATTALANSVDKLHLTAVQYPNVTSTTTTQCNVKPEEGGVDVEMNPTNYEKTTNDDEQTLNAYAPSQTPNEELLSAMMNMFSDFTSDLRSQADDLRAERDRLRALKEDLLRRKRQS